MVDIPKVGLNPQTANAALSATVQASAQEAAKSLASNLGVAIGEKTSALVTAITHLSDAERTYLLEQMAKAKQQNTAGLPARVIAAKTDLAQSSSTRLIEVTINNKTVALLSQLPLQEGAALTVRVRPDGQLQLVMQQATQTNTAAKPQAANVTAQEAMAKPTANPAPSPAQSQTTNPPNLSSPQGKLIPTSESVLKTPSLASQTDAVNSNKPSQSSNSEPLAKPPGRLTENVNWARTRLEQHYGAPKFKPMQVPLQFKNETQLGPVVQKQLHQLREAIKVNTPHAKPLANVLRQLQDLPTRLPTQQLQQQPQVLKALQSLVSVKQGAVDLKQLSFQPVTTTREAITNSGVLLERHLQQSSKAPYTSTALDQDPKAALATALNNVTSVLNTLPQITQTLDKPLLEQLFQLFAKPQANNAASPEANSKFMQQKLEQITQGIRASIAQIQLQQYRSAVSTLTEPLHNQPSLFMEFPIRLFDGFGTIFLLWQEQEPEKTKKKKASGKTKYTAKWRVFMELEIGESDTLAVDLQVADKNLDAQMWASTESLERKASEQMEILKTQLQNQGLQVNDLRCHQNAPMPQRPTAMDYSMIDLKT